MNIKKLIFVLFAISFVLPCFAVYNSFGVPDSSEIRKDLIETWFEAPLQNVRMNRPEIRTNSVGEKFQIRLEETEDSFNIFVAPYAKIEVDVYSDKGKTTEVQDVYPGDAPGSFLLVRDKKTGKPIRIRYYFASDSEVFVQFVPVGRTAYSDFLIFSSYAAKGVPTGLPFERFYSSSFDEIVRWTKLSLPWKYAKIFPEDYHASLQMINVIKEKNPKVLLTEDAMYDDEGNCVHISTGKKIEVLPEDKGKIIVSGAGYLKWISDGIIEPLTGGLLKREPLLEQTVEYKETGFQGILSEKYAVSFSLDWIRNLSSAVISVRSKHNYIYKNSGTDVTIEPFCAELTDKGINNSLGYVENSGYQVKAIKPLLYVLACENPGLFYFGAIRETDRRSPEVKIFNECCVFFPYFDSKKRFNCTIFKDGSEISLEDFLSRYYSDFVSLVKVHTTEQFYPNVDF